MWLSCTSVLQKGAVVFSAMILYSKNFLEMVCVKNDVNWKRKGLSLLFICLLPGTISRKLVCSGQMCIVWLCWICHVWHLTVCLSLLASSKVLIFQNKQMSVAKWVREILPKMCKREGRYSSTIHQQENQRRGEWIIRQDSAKNSAKRWLKQFARSKKCKLRKN